MYRITDENGNVIAQVDSPRYVRLKAETGAWIQCPAHLAECIAINGVRYSLVGRDLVDDAPIAVYVYEIDAAQELYNTTERVKIIDEDLTQTQKALVEVYENNISTEDELTQTQLALVDLYENLLGGNTNG